MIKKDIVKISDAWEAVMLELGPPGLDLQVISNARGRGDFFHATAMARSIRIEPSINNTPSCKLSQPRTVFYPEFECIAKHFNDYFNRKRGIREYFRDTCGQNSSYIITMINDLVK